MKSQIVCRQSMYDVQMHFSFKMQYIAKSGRKKRDYGLWMVYIASEMYLQNRDHVSYAKDD